MSGSEFMTELTKTDNPNPEGGVFSGIWSSYERVILHSLITSFGLDFLVEDQPGGDVDTIRSVRDESIPLEERYKNPAHLDAYENRGAYDAKAYVELSIPMPWTGDFDTFMGNRNNKLIFGRRMET